MSARLSEVCLLLCLAILPPAAGWRVAWFYDHAQPDGTNETRIYDDHSILALETASPANRLTLEVTNGNHYVRITSANDGTILDCDVTNNADMATDFTKRFFARPDSYLGNILFQEEVTDDEDDEEEGEGEETAEDILLDPFPDRYLAMIDIGQLENTCYRYHTTYPLTPVTVPQRPLVTEPTTKHPPTAKTTKPQTTEPITNRPATSTRGAGGGLDFRSLLFVTGTKWCGPGNMADGYTDLGTKREADMCCRTHDHCPDQLAAGTTRWNITHTGVSTWSHCQCDQVLYDCLKAVGTDTADNVGYFYFNLFKIPCFEFTETRDCLEYGSDGTNCTRYSEPQKQGHVRRRTLKY